MNGCRSDPYNSKSHTMHVFEKYRYIFDCFFAVL